MPLLQDHALVPAVWLARPETAWLVSKEIQASDGTEQLKSSSHLLAPLTSTSEDRSAEAHMP